MPDAPDTYYAQNYAGIIRQTLTSIPFDYLLISSWVTNFVSSREFLTCHFILDRIDRELHSLKSLDLKFGLSSE